MRIFLIVVLLFAVVAMACDNPQRAKEEADQGLTNVRTIMNPDVQITEFNLHGHMYFIARPRGWEGAALMHDPDCQQDRQGTR